MYSLFAFGSKEEVPRESEIIIEKITDMQDRYDSINPAVPGMVMFSADTTSIIPAEIAAKIDNELSRQLILSGKIKPISILKWLSSKYFERKANNPFTLMRAIQAEHYAIPLLYLCKPYLFQCENYFILYINVYPLAAAAYPISILRLFETAEDIPSVIAAVIEEMQFRIYEENQGVNKKRIIADSFNLEFLKLVTLDSGEFEFIEAPFIDQYGKPLRSEDDFFSVIFAYILSTTQLFDTMRPADFSDFALSSSYNSSAADYRIEGRVQLSAELSILHVTVRDIRYNTVVISIQYPLHDCSLKNIWNAYREISVKIIEAIYPQASYGMVPNLIAPERAFYVNNMFVGWDEIENFILPKGMHELHTGSYFHPGVLQKGFERPEIIIGNEADEENIHKNSSVEKSSVKTFYVLLDTIDRVFMDREGEYVWNFLRKN
jgi:hypothetical protein